LKINKDMYI